MSKEPPTTKSIAKGLLNEPTLGQLQVAHERLMALQRRINLLTVKLSQAQEKFKQKREEARVEHESHTKRYIACLTTGLVVGGAVTAILFLI